MSTGKNIQGALSYNEQKVREGTAELLLASHFGGEVLDMGFSEKLLRFKKLNQLSEKTKTNTLHLSLNFSPDDDLNDEKLRRIAFDYMERIGFGGQPFLVYRHDDTGHPHLHILTTTIRSNGKPIYLHNLAKRKSEPARKALEIEYNLIKAEGRKQSTDLGRSTKISNIVSQVVAQYKFTSLEELNGILRQFNIMADAGQPGSFLEQKRGLVFSEIDGKGYKIGKPIKASDIYKSPTLAVLEKKFKQNQISALFTKKKVKGEVLKVLNESTTPSQFIQGLKNMQIGCSIQYDKEDNISNVSFIDHQTHTIFSAAQFGLTINELLQKANYSNPSGQGPSKPINTPMSSTIDERKNAANHTLFIIKALFESEPYQPEISLEFFKKKRKKKKR